MFWTSIIGGLKVLTFWEVYAAAFIFTVISVGPMFIFGLIGQKNEAVGCLGGMLIAPIFQALATIIFVFTLFPILLGFAEDAAWSFPWKILFSSPWPMIKASFIIIIATIALAFIPLLGQIQSLHTFASGAISLIMVLGILHSAYPNIPIQKISIMPGFLTIIGFLFIAGVVSWASTMLVAVIATALGDSAEDYTALIAIPLGGVFGFIPVFIYGAYIGNQLMRAM
ncbi:MAG: hypothetical protein JW821_11290 [Deltaproteobacteria bacterium]|nr:hypothetical protein [Deltaproteobacteria bacterium]